MTTLVDTHCHLNFDAFDTDRETIIQQATQAGVTRIIIPAVDIETAQQSLALAEQHTGIFVAVGVHPNSTKDFTPDTLEGIRQLAKHPKVVAIGEIGLDYHWDFSPKDAQHSAFWAQLALAKDCQLPIIIHNREASTDVMDILEAWVPTLTPEHQARVGVLHSFSGDEHIAKRALACGFYLGFTGPITYKNAEETRHIASLVPADRLLLETDAPYLTPIPYRGKRNTPAYIPLIAERLAIVRNTTLEEIARQTTENAVRLFGLS
jgi:TatD DNase family protein